MSQIPYVSNATMTAIGQYILGELTTRLASKVDTVSGKGLSTEDFTAAFKEKLETINLDNLLSAQDKAKIHEHSNKSVLDAITQAAVDAWTAAETNIIESVKVNGTAQTVTNKEINIAVPTRVSDLNNDSGFQNATQGATAIAAAVDAITGIDFSIVVELPASGVKGTIYLVAAENNGMQGDVYNEYIWLDGVNDNPGRFEKIGTTEAKLSNYWSKSELTFTEITASDVTTIFNAVFHPEQNQQAGE